MAEQGRSRARGSRKGRRHRSRGRRITVATLKALVIVVCLAVIAGCAVVAIGYRSTDLPDPHADFQTATTFVYYNDGKTKLGTFAVQNRTPLTYEEMPQNIKDAVIAAENRSFWTDPGISIKGILRSAWSIATGGELQGGSTITQEYIKILYLNSERTFQRKFTELLLAVKMSRRVSKEDILTGYLNTIYFGRGAYGIEAASKAYFNEHASQLTLPQAAVLASILNNPSLYDPSGGKEDRQRLLHRYRYVLDGMADMGTITAAQQAKYRKKLPKFPEVPVSNRYGGPNGFLLKMVQAELQRKGFSEQQINGGGLRITTTFDQSAQKAAVEAAQHYTKEAAKANDKKASNLHAAIASVDVKTGGVLALYGGPDYVENSRNWATTPRMTGSTFKAYALAAGLENGFSLRSVLNGNTFTPPGDTVPVRNEFHIQYGPVTLLRATANSINTAFVDMTTQMTDGPQKVIKAAEEAGVPKRNDSGWYPGSRIALGVAEVSPLNQATAYSTFARGGSYLPHHVVAKVTDASGRVLYTAKPKEKRVFPRDVTRDITYALSDVVEEGTGQSVQTVDRPVAGKTGTAGVGDDIVSAWFVAYTKQISTAVMYVAGDGGNADLDPYRRPGDAAFFGGSYPALTWAEYTSKASEGMPVEEFPPPAWVNKDAAPPTRPAAPQTTSDQPSQTQEATPTESQTAPSTPPPSSSAPPPPSTPTQPTSKPPTTTAPPPSSSGGPTSREPSQPPSSLKTTAPLPTTGGGDNGGGDEGAGGGGSGGEPHASTHPSTGG